MKKFNEKRVLATGPKISVQFVKKTISVILTSIVLLACQTASKSHSFVSGTTEVSADFVIVGAGGAGLSAAISAAQQGLKVLILEKMFFAGGATVMSGGGTTATGSQWQKGAGVKDDPEWLFMDMLKNGHFYNNPHTTWFYANKIGPSFDWLVSPDGAGIPYGRQLSGPSAEHRAGRTYSATGGGAGLIESLVNKAASMNIDILYSVKADGLILENGTVSGVTAAGPNGSRYRIYGKAVLLATGGYGANSEFISEEIKKLPYAGSVSATGDGLIMAVKAGAASFNMDKINIQPHSIRFPDGRGQHTFQGILYVYNNTGGMLISQDGVRIVNEQASNYDILMAMKKEEQCYLLMDKVTYQRYIDIAVASHNFTKVQADEWLAANGKMTPIFAGGQTLEELAETIHVPPDALVKTVSSYNGYAAAGRDPDFGRKLTGPMASDGPYYAVAMDLRYYATLGGLRINDDLEVLDTNDKPIPGLYAAGEVVGGVNGDIYTSSTCVGWALASGYQAGLAAARKLKP
ncbi:MAG: FAD-dependent oxidoreductase [Spirochaetaceae bacterium]|jgi:fumarate reductase flavoprotein subunit|nr:FAD-dependent oxidoreductase [Spirochaetaceae bacterium]